MNFKKVVIITVICAVILSACSKSEQQSNADKELVQTSMEDTSPTDALKEEYVGCMPFAIVSKLIRTSQKIYSEDNGALWGQKLESRIMVIDAESGKFIASENNADNNLKPMGDYYVGELPDGIIVANSTLQYGGKNWAQISYNDSTEFDEILPTYLHEMFHNNQEALGHTASFDEWTGYDNSHMDEMDARIYIKLEWDALFKALESEGEEKQKAIKAALAFRGKRREIYNKASDENCFEIEEGLPDYTAFSLYYKEKDKLMTAIKEDWDKVLNEECTPSYIRSFGYHSGLCYAILLDQSKIEWKSYVKPGCDLGDLLKQAYNISDINTDCEAIKNDYGYAEIEKIESERKDKRDAKVAELKAKFVDGQVLIIKLNNLNYGFNPRKIWNVTESGKVYEEAEVISEQGTIEADQILINDENEVFLPVDNMKINGNIIIGEGWSIELAEGYEIIELENGNYEVVEKK